ncbi:hypothetical protein L6452_30448 [Arctium lappa]|uniref:Uncharacterized protein n=2 Tax=Arctium lappa TaxID=4217 RepID=A0ACB8ZJB8_ARCLA|nr:hypothetical protein L6452_45219 [Arctium lappa]KAI3697431.1 hypothetical protein L6452_30442 [Arctium lappa]KAI3697436.1 hypothetical protein L6452_30448 [Arctium lappa]
MSLLNQFVIGLIKAGKGLFGLLANGKALTTLDEYQKNFGDSWKAIQADCSQAWPYLDEALTRFQDPAQADKLLKIHRELDETKIILFIELLKCLISIVGVDFTMATRVDDVDFEENETYAIDIVTRTRYGKVSRLQFL